MADVTFKGTPVALRGREVKVGQPAPDFSAVDTSLQPVRLADARGKVLILSAVPSLDTPVCDTETRRFNQEAAKLPGGVEVWTISMDLPFAQKRWCGAAGIDRVKTLSDFRDRSFGQGYGVAISGGPPPGSPATPVPLARAGHHVHRGPQPARVRVQVDLRGRHRGVAEQVGDHVDPAPGIGEVAAAGVPQLMRCHRRGQDGPP